MMSAGTDAPAPLGLALPVPRKLAEPLALKKKRNHSASMAATSGRWEMIGRGPSPCTCSCNTCVSGIEHCGPQQYSRHHCPTKGCCRPLRNRQFSTASVETPITTTGTNEARGRVQNLEVLTVYLSTLDADDATKNAFNMTAPWATVRILRIDLLTVAGDWNVRRPPG